MTDGVWGTLAEARLGGLARRIEGDGSVVVSRLYEVGAELAAAAEAVETSTVMVSVRPNAWVELRVVIATKEQEFEHTAFVSVETSSGPDAHGLVLATGVEWGID